MYGDRNTDRCGSFDTSPTQDDPLGTLSLKINLFSLKQGTVTAVVRTKEMSKCRARQRTRQGLEDLSDCSSSQIAIVQDSVVLGELPQRVPRQHTLSSWIWILIFWRCLGMKITSTSEFLLIARISLLLCHPNQ